MRDKYRLTRPWLDFNGNLMPWNNIWFSLLPLPEPLRRLNTSLPNNKKNMVSLWMVSCICGLCSYWC